MGLGKDGGERWRTCSSWMDWGGVERPRGDAGAINLRISAAADTRWNVW